MRNLGKLWSGGLGARVIHLTDGRYVVASVADGSPAADAGFRLGTEIVSIDGADVAERLRTVPPLGFPGTDEKRESVRLMHLLSYPLGQGVDVAYRQPGDAAVRTARLTAQEVREAPTYSFPANAGQPISFEFLADGAIGYIQWRSFDHVAINIAGWEHFLESMVGRPGMIIDLRGNGGGLQTLMYAMASYLFPAAKAVRTDWLDDYEFDEQTKSFVKAPSGPPTRIHSPRPELAYDGTVVVLVDGGSASAAEFFTQFLQKAGRATVIAEQGTDGAGGSVRQVLMPGKITFTFTGSQMYFARTREPNLEGKGVIPDVRVPITEANERRKLSGEDVVLSAAREYIQAKLPKPSTPQ